MSKRRQSKRGHYQHHLQLGNQSVQEQTAKLFVENHRRPSHLDYMKGKEPPHIQESMHTNRDHMEQSLQQYSENLSAPNMERR